MMASVPLPERLAAQVAGLLTTMEESYDPVEQINMAHKVNQVLLNAQGTVAEIRRQAVRTLRMEGWTLREIAEQTGMTHQRVAQIEAGADRKEKG